MPHDYYNELLAPGDLVYVPCKVKAVHATEEYCNVDLETLHPMPPGENRQSLTLNTRQTVRTIKE